MSGKQDQEPTARCINSKPNYAKRVKRVPKDAIEIASVQPKARVVINDIGTVCEIVENPEKGIRAEKRVGKRGRSKVVLCRDKVYAV